MALDILVLAEPIIQGEGKWMKFTFTVAGAIFPLTGSEFSFTVKEDLDTALALYEAITFDDTHLATGIVRVNLPASATRTLPPGKYFGELTTVINPDSEVDKKMVKFTIQQAVTP